MYIPAHDARPCACIYRQSMAARRSTRQSKFKNSHDAHPCASRLVASSALAGHDVMHAAILHRMLLSTTSCIATIRVIPTVGCMTSNWPCWDQVSAQAWSFRPLSVPACSAAPGAPCSNFTVELEAAEGSGASSSGADAAVWGAFPEDTWNAATPSVSFSTSMGSSRAPRAALDTGRPSALPSSVEEELEEEPPQLFLLGLRGESLEL